MKLCCFQELDQLFNTNELQQRQGLGRLAFAVQEGGNKK